MVLPNLAAAIGLNEAIVLQQVHYWLENPKAGVVVDGEKWIHNTYAEWQENFPFWSVETVKRTINELERVGLLISAQTSKNPFDKTKSYRIDYDSLDGVNLTSSFTETTVSETNNTSSVPSDIPEDYPVEWQIAAGIKAISLPDQGKAMMKDSAMIMSMGLPFPAKSFDLAYAFMLTRGIIIPESKCKGQRKILKEMVGMKVEVQHVVEATKKLLESKMTVTDLYSIAKTAEDLANPAPEDTEYKGPAKWE